VERTGCGRCHISSALFNGPPFTTKLDFIVPYPPCNMQKQEPYQKKIRTGDLFRLQYPRNRFLFGLVARVLPVEKSKMYVVTIFRDESSSAAVIPKLSRNRLLIGPRIINRLGFSRGYMTVVDNIPLAAKIAFSDYVIRRSPDIWKLERGVVQEGENLVVFDFSGNYRSLDRDISEALGIDYAPEEI